ncbi:MAG: putative 2-phosphotransferase [Mucilaginibacter sp.]|nr:putative 2-phosphotransferase [Mucilaginibacter sp.]
MLSEERLVHVSKFLSKHLRHQPERLGLVLAPGGWVPVTDLLTACARAGLPVSPDELEEVVRTNSKQRFSFDATGTLIRANQGHSVEVDLQLAPRVPPDVLYHGTGERSVQAIQERGILKMSRQHLHLSSDVATARSVGARHGRPVVFAIHSAAMVRDGHLFYLSDNGVWLVEHVPCGYLQRI